MALVLSQLDGTTGFRIVGVEGSTFGASAVAGAGDINGDGVDDLIIGAYGAALEDEPYSGASFVVFGSSSGFGASLSLAELDGSDGFGINGERYSGTGNAVDGARDVNGDGFGDLIIGASAITNHSSSAFVVFGSNKPFGAQLNITDLNGTNGFQRGFSGDGSSVTGAGDINGDGIDDVAVGWDTANAGVATVLFRSSKTIELTRISHHG